MDGMLNTVKMSVPPKATHRLNVNLIKIPLAFVEKTEKLILKLIRNCKGL